MFTAVDKGDDERTIPNVVFEIRKVCSQVKARKVVIYPFVHLTTTPSDPKTALELLKKIEEALSGEFEVYRAPFGWYKKFVISCKGHPLAELSRTITGSEKKEKHKTDKKFFVMTPEGELIKAEDYKPKSKTFKRVLDKEAFGKALEEKKQQPRYASYCKKLGIEWEPMSDFGHMRYGPKGALVFDLLSEYALHVSKSLGIPVYSVKGTNMFNLNEKSVREHAELFGDRLYKLEVDGKPFILRYAACHQQFAMIRDWVVSYKHLPFAAFEVADSYRLEQSGELMLCFRLRKFFMPDTHVFCADEEQARQWFLKVDEVITREANSIGRDYELLVNASSEKALEENKEVLKKLLSKHGKPALICVYSGGANYYWTVNVEYLIIDSLNRPREIGTVQIDVGNAERFGITYTDKEGSKKHPVILHTAFIGSIERYLYALLDNAAMMEKQGKPPMLPVWLAPIQARIIPVSEEYLKHAEELLKEMKGVRVDVDDTNETISKKIRNAEKEWIPFIIVIGEKEVKEKTLTVRIRGKGQEKMTLEELLARIRIETEGKPFKPLPVPDHVSKTPVF